jgi:TRAP-type C4-dicarboxylate transport system permease small subunit
MVANMKNGKLYVFIDNLEKHVCNIALAAMLVIVFWQVVLRYVFNSANPWSEESARYLNILVVYVSCAYAIRFHDHIKIDALVLIFPKSIRPALIRLGEVLMFLFFIALTNEGFRLAASVLEVGRVTSGMGIKSGYVYLLAPMGFTLSAIRLAENWADAAIDWAKRRKGKVLEKEGGEI